MEIPKYKAYDPNTGLECDVTTKDNIVTWEVKNDDSVEDSVYYNDRYNGSYLE